jgi:hypothetical protein
MKKLFYVLVMCTISLSFQVKSAERPAPNAPNTIREIIARYDKVTEEALKLAQQLHTAQQRKFWQEYNLNIQTTAYLIRNYKEGKGQFVGTTQAEADDIFSRYIAAISKTLSETQSIISSYQAPIEEDLPLPTVWRQAKPTQTLPKPKIGSRHDTSEKPQPAVGSWKEGHDRRLFRRTMQLPRQALPPRLMPPSETQAPERAFPDSPSAPAEY